MELKVRIVGKNWQSNGKGFYFCGYIVNKTSGKILKDIDDVIDYVSTIDFLDEIEGEYTYVEDFEDDVRVKTDATKLYPLWYRQYSDKIVITDDFYSLIDPNHKIDRTQKQIFEQNGALLGDSTLFKDIYRVEYSMIFSKERMERLGHIVKVDFSKPLFTFESLNDATIENDFCKAIDRAFDVMFSSLSPEQQIVIPLSGGYDSRLIACMVKKRGWKNVLAYTMGKDIEGEQSVARIVAEKLGFKFVQIDFEKVVRQSEVSEISTDLKKCIDFVGQGQNFEWLADYYAVKYLRLMELLEDNAVFIPGFCGDVNGGSYHRKLMVGTMTDDWEVIDRLMTLRFERGNPMNILLQIKLLKYHPSNRNNMQFFMEKYLPNKILNACRVPFYFGYEVRLPFFNRYFLEFCYHLPDEYLKDRVVYNEVLMKHYFEPDNVGYEKKEQNTSVFLKQYFKNYIKLLIPRYFKVNKRNFVDTVQEIYLSTGMRKELVMRGKMRNENDYLSANEVMSKYLLMIMEERVNKEG